MKAPALSLVEDLGRKAEALRALLRTLLDLAQGCHGDTRPDYPIIVRISGDASG